MFPVGETMADDDGYVCVNCGKPIHQLFKRYSEDVLRMTVCVGCDKVADHYVETDFVVTFIDLLLLRTEAYRHIIYNLPTKSYWKLSFVLLFCDSYKKWIKYKSIEHIVSHDYDQRFFVLEWNFYLMFLSSFYEQAVLLLTVLACTKLFQVLHFKPSFPKNFSYRFLCKWLLFSSYGKIAAIAVIIWVPDDLAVFYYFLVSVFVITSNAQVYKVVCRMNFARSVCVMAAASLSNLMLTSLS